MELDPIIVGVMLIAGLPALLLLRVLFGPGGVSMEDLLSRPDLAWPRGVQEEEPICWRIERLTLRDRHRPMPSSRPVPRSKVSTAATSER